jgi:hypothetical protein
MLASLFSHNQTNTFYYKSTRTVTQNTHSPVICHISNFSPLLLLFQGVSTADVVDAAGTTPLMHCAVVGDARSARMLLTLGAQATARDRSGRTARDLACLALARQRALAVEGGGCNGEAARTPRADAAAVYSVLVLAEAGCGGESAAATAAEAEAGPTEAATASNKPKKTLLPARFSKAKKKNEAKAVAARCTASGSSRGLIGWLSRF